jgi:Domain of unknown function (DUF4260)
MNAMTTSAGRGSTGWSDRTQASRSRHVSIALRIAGAAVFFAVAFVYVRLGGGWAMALALLLAPDLSFLGFVLGVKQGVVAYNSVHRPIVPLLLLAAGLIVSSRLVLLLALIWLAHIAMDRAAGYGLREVAPAPDQIGLGS